MARRATVCPGCARGVVGGVVRPGIAQVRGTDFQGGPRPAVRGEPVTVRGVRQHVACEGHLRSAQDIASDTRQLVRAIRDAHGRDGCGELTALVGCTRWPPRDGPPHSCV